MTSSGSRSKLCKKQTLGLDLPYLISDNPARTYPSKPRSTQPHLLFPYYIITVTWYLLDIPKNYNMWRYHNTSPHHPLHASWTYVYMASTYCYFVNEIDSWYTVSKDPGILTNPWSITSGSRYPPFRTQECALQLASCAALTLSNANAADQHPKCRNQKTKTKKYSHRTGLRSIRTRKIWKRRLKCL